MRTIWIAARNFGAPSEPWLWRQVVGFRHLRPRVVTWDRQNTDAYPLPPEVEVDQVPFPAAPHDGSGRFIYRARNIVSRNFFASVGRERKWLLNLARETQPAAILCHFGHVALRLLPVAQSLNIPLVAHFHGLDVSSGLRNKWYRWSIQRALPHFAAIVVVGSHQRQWMLDHGVPAERVHLIPCGVPTDEFTPTNAPTSGGIQFICVSRLVEFKGIDYSLRAFAKVKEVYADARLVVIGDGPERKNLERLTAELGLHSGVSFLGNQPVSVVREQLKRSHVFLQHSLLGRDGSLEGFGVSIAEAAACGLPVVVSNCGGITDQVVDGSTGFVVPQRDTAAMAEAMNRLAADGELRTRLGQGGRERMVEHFDTRSQIHKLENVICGAITKTCG